MWKIDESPFHTILMDVVSMVHIVLSVPNSMIGETALPDFTLSSDQAPEGMRVTALDQLNGMFQRHVLSWSE